MISVLSMNLVLISCLFGQIKEFQILDSENKGIQFVNLYSKYSNYGTISNINGIVNFDFERIKKLDTIQISCIGYETKIIAVDSLVRIKDGAIFLNNTYYNIDEVSVTAQKIKYKNRKTGIRTRLGLCQRGFYVNKDDAGEEYGVIMK